MAHRGHRINLKLPDDSHKQVVALARKEARSVANMAVALILEALAAREGKA